MKDPIRDPEMIETAHLENIKQIDGADVLEIGCGNGRLIRRYAHRVRSVIGIDPSEDSLKEALEAGPLPGGAPFALVQGSATDLPFRARSFNVAILAWSL